VSFNEGHQVSKYAVPLPALVRHHSRIVYNDDSAVRKRGSIKEFSGEVSLPLGYLLLPGTMDFKFEIVQSELETPSAVVEVEVAWGIDDADL